MGRRRGGQLRDPVGRALPTRTGICSALFGAALVHGTVVDEHARQWVLAGAFFLCLQVVEVGLALAAGLAWSRRTAQLVVITGVGTVAIWLISRTTGLPIGPPSFRSPEAVGIPDLTCLVLELLAALLAMPAALGRRPREGRSGPVQASTLMVACLAVTAWGVVPHS